MRKDTSAHYNVLLILTDQLRADCLGCYGNPIARTPNIDRIAGQGMRFDRAYVQNPVCMPSRASILTGLYPRTHGVWTNGVPLDTMVPTLPGFLAEAGTAPPPSARFTSTPWGRAPNLTTGNRTSTGKSIRK